MKVTDYERVAEVIPTQLGQFHCPKCVGLCNEVSPEKRSQKKWREFSCSKCGRGWTQLPPWAMSVSDAHKVVEEGLFYGQV